MRILKIREFLEISRVRRRLLFLAVAAVLIVIVVTGGFLWERKQHRILVLGVISDIHAGDQKARDDGVEPENVLLPANYEKNLRNALENLRDADIVIALGDNLNKSGKKHAQKLSEIAKEFKREIIWTRGNHDDQKQFAEFLSPDNYYFRDYGKWRIIVLDNTEKFPDYVKGDELDNVVNEHGRGFIDAAQLEWLEKLLKTEKNVIIAMHIPLFYRNNLGETRFNQKELKEFFNRHENIKYVLAGHFHIADWNAKIDGIEYFIVPSLSLENREGYFLKLNLE